MKTDYLSIIRKFKKYKILVVGDFILDVYLEGNCSRLAPEAAVPVVDVTVKKYCLGAAGNVAANLTALGAEVLLCSVTGQDEAARRSFEMLKEAGISTDLVLTSSERATIVKTRVNAPSHTLVRYDEGTEKPISARAEQELIGRLERAYKDCDAVLIADYDKGMLSPGLIAKLKQLKQQKDKFFAIDSKRAEAFAEIRPQLIKPNYEEAIKLLALPYCQESRIEQMKPFGVPLFEKTNAGLVALTLDNEGALFFENGCLVHRSFAPQVNNPKVSGAGDTFISTCLLTLLNGDGVTLAAELATTAAGIAIRKADTATCSGVELTNLLTEGDKKISDMGLLQRKCQLYKAEGKRLVFTNGCFDILHSGHVNYLRKAREMGDILIVGLNNDDSIRRLKGANRPVNSLKNRIEVLSALEFVDLVIPFGNSGDDTPVKLIKRIRPDVFVKGGDYQHKYLPEEKLLKRIRCEIIFLPYVFNQSTTQIINRIERTARLNIAIAN
jgi:D-beta-D-heptose 7-phosphate kinase/D-beta-D-heptose 1-phosphate adenosyltransferase